MATKKVKKSSRVSVVGGIPKLQFEMSLDAKKIKAIHRCIEKGTLRITFNRVDLGTGRLGEGWLYD